MKTSHTLVITSLALFGLSACGGSDSNGSPTPTPAPVTLVTVNSGNATKIAGTASEAALESVEIGGLTDITGATSSAQGNTNKQDVVSVASKVAQGTLVNAQYIPIGPETTFCAVSGSVTVSGDLASPLTFTAGDFINVDSDMCNDGEGEVVDGLLEMTISDFDGDLATSEFLFGIDLVLTEFMVSMVTEPLDTMTANGDVGTTIDTRTPPVMEGSVFGDSFVVTAMGETQSIFNFSTIYTEDASGLALAWTNNSMGTVSSSEVSGGAVTYETPVTFAGSGANYPHTGHLLITGANNATLLLRTIDDVDIEIDADYDGDTIVDETFTMTWAELEAQN